MPRGLTGLNSWVRDLLFPVEFSHVENVSTWLACGIGKNRAKGTPLHMYLKKQLEKMRIISNVTQTRCQSQS